MATDCEYVTLILCLLTIFEALNVEITIDMRTMIRCAICDSKALPIPSVARSSTWMEMGRRRVKTNLRLHNHQSGIHYVWEQCGIVMAMVSMDTVSLWK